jgi:hypothetical protein
MVIDGMDKSTTTATAADERKGRQNGSYLLKLETPIVATNFFEFDDHVRWIQDSQSRMTILVRSEDDYHPLPTMIGQGTLYVPISSNTTTYIRIIVEDVDHFHNGTRKVPTYFGDLMTRDFWSPVEAYTIQS